MTVAKHLQKYVGEFKKLTMEDLIELGKMVNQARDVVEREMVKGLRIGQKVSFEDSRVRNGIFDPARSDDGRIHGVVAKINQKTIGVKTDGGANWRVSPSLIRVEPNMVFSKPVRTDA